MSREQTYARQVTREAAVWFATMQQQRVSRDERQNFARWLSQSVLHVQEYLAVAAAWRMSADAVGINWPAMELIVAARAKLAERSVVPLKVAPIRESFITKTAGYRAVAKWRAALVCGAMLALVWLWARGGAAEYRAGVGDQLTTSLADGSQVKLNTRTRIRARLSASFRDVELLEGEAIFKVAKDPGRPFRVFVNGSEIRAVGTEFDVYRQKDVTMVTVLEGHVEVVRTSPSPLGLFAAVRTESSPMMPVLARLSPRQQAAVALDGEVLRTKTVDVGGVTAWTQALLRFSDQTLGEVVEQFNRYNRRRMVLEDPAIAAVRLSGVFSSTDVDSFLAYLKQTESIQTREQDGTIHIASDDRHAMPAVPDFPR